MQRIGPAITRGAGAWHHGYAGACFDHAAHRFKAGRHARADRCACPGRWRCLPVKGLDGAVRVDAELIVDQVHEVRGLGGGQRWSSDVTHGEPSSRNSGADVQPFHRRYCRHQPQVARTARMAMTMSPELQPDIHVRFSARKVDKASARKELVVVVFASAASALQAAGIGL